jgi:hypothetical protein
VYEMENPSQMEELQGCSPSPRRVECRAQAVERQYGGSSSLSVTT